jgi:hypothetical protein
MTRYVSDNERYGMRRDRAEARTEREAKYGFSRRIVRRVTADVNPRVQYSEEELRGLVRVSQPT